MRRAANILINFVQFSQMCHNRIQSNSIKVAFLIQFENSLLQKYIITYCYSPYEIIKQKIYIYIIYIYKTYFTLKKIANDANKNLVNL